jgi:hypothetical protein
VPGSQSAAGLGCGPHPAREYQPSTGAVKGSKILWPLLFRTHTNPPRTEPLHGQSIFEVLRTKPLTAPAPGSARRLSSEAHHVGSHSHKSDWTAPVILEALIPERMQSHAGTAEVPR